MFIVISGVVMSKESKSVGGYIEERSDAKDLLFYSPLDTERRERQIVFNLPNVLSFFQENPDAKTCSFQIRQSRYRETVTVENPLYKERRLLFLNLLRVRRSQLSGVVSKQASVLELALFEDKNR